MFVAGKSAVRSYGVGHITVRSNAIVLAGAKMPSGVASSPAAKQRRYAVTPVRRHAMRLPLAEKTKHARIRCSSHAIASISSRR